MFSVQFQEILLYQSLHTILLISFKILIVHQLQVAIAVELVIQFTISWFLDIFLLSQFKIDEIDY